MKKKIIYILPLAMLVIAATAFVIQTQIVKSKPATFHSVAKAWCKAKGGVFDDSISVLPECEIDVYKGSAGINIGTDRYNFSYQVVDYDTGRAIVMAEKRLSVRDYVANGFVSPKPFEIGSFIKKGKYN